MSEFIFNLSDISASDGSAVVTVNNSDSVFGVVEGSQLFIAGKLPSTILESSTTDSTITLSSPWSQGDLSSVAAKIIPIGTVAELLTALERNRAAYQAFVATIEGQEEPLTEVEWGNIVASTLPEFVKRWGKYSEITEKPDYAQGWPDFENVTGKVTQEQLPDSIETDSKRTQALSPPVKTEASLTHLLIDYPKLKLTETTPTESPNNRRLILFDDIRGLVHVALTDRWFSIPNTISHRKFMVKIADRYIQLNSSYTGTITMRVYPLGGGGYGLPNNPTLANNQWHTITESVSGLSQIARDFEGIIDYIEMNGRWQTFDSDQSHFHSIDAYYASGSGAAVSPFRDFYLRNDGYWYGNDITPETPLSMGPSWSQDATNKKLFTVSGAVDGDDALRFFGSNFDGYEMEVIINSNVDNDLALTISNSDPNIVYYSEIGKYITNERIYLKRNNTAITGTVEFESIRMRLASYE